MRIQRRPKNLQTQLFIECGNSIFAGAIKKLDGGYRVTSWLADSNGDEAVIIAYESSNGDVAKVLVEAAKNTRNELQARLESFSVS